MGRCRYLTSVSAFGIFVCIFQVDSVFGIDISKYCDIRFGILAGPL